MSQRITIEIKDKIATCLTELPVVCGNSDYVVDFVFDEEWNAHEVKTAIFVVNGKAIPQVFAGNVCPIPVIQNTLIAWVGVFAGTVDDGTLSTSTPALVKCVPCITDGDNVPAPPPDDVYNQIIGLINAGMLRGETGEKGEKGDKGDAGSIKFIPVAELPTENIDESAIYLVPIDGADGENRFTEYVYIDGKWEVIGAITVQVDHSEYVKFTDIANGLYKNSQGKIIISKAERPDIAKKTNAYNPLVPQTQDYAWKVSATDNKEEWTDEERAAACGTIGAVKQVAYDIKLVPPNGNDGTYWGVVYAKSYENKEVAFPVANQNRNYTIPIREHNGNFYVGTPKNTWHCANKGYVDDLIAELRAEIAALKGE